jgi:hypothetical protein
MGFRGHLSFISLYTQLHDFIFITLQIEIRTNIHMLHVKCSTYTTKS